MKPVEEGSVIRRDRMGLPARGTVDPRAHRKACAARSHHLADTRTLYGAADGDGVAIGSVGVDPGALSRLDAEPTNTDQGLSIRQRRNDIHLMTKVRGRDVVHGARLQHQAVSAYGHADQPGAASSCAKSRTSEGQSAMSSAKRSRSRR